MPTEPLAPTLARHEWREVSDAATSRSPLTRSWRWSRNSQLGSPPPPAHQPGAHTHTVGATLTVLIDYDNVGGLLRSRGATAVVERVVHTLGPSLLQTARRVRARLYGGWYSDKRYSRAAQTISAELKREFPRRLRVTAGSGSVDVSVQAELAESLEIAPRRTLFHTYRSRGPQKNLRCLPAPFSGCIRDATTCELASLASFLAKEVCPASGCIVEPADVLVRAEQKLVDTMMVADIIHLARNQPEPICVVTSDDDLWPGISSALSLGAKVIHMHTSVGRVTAPFYTTGTGPAYVQQTLS